MILETKNQAKYNSTSTILMVRPSNFGMNPETVSDNAFHHVEQQSQQSAEEIRAKAVQQFDGYVAILQSHSVNVIVIQDTMQPIKMDAVFPNNWFTAHSNQIILYPMKPANRRAERQNPVIEQLRNLKYCINDIIDLSGNESANPPRFLEGTGSMVLDHQNRIAYACRSQRTSQSLFQQVCSQYLNYKPILFTALDANNKPIYHTNCVMSVCSGFVVICLDSIADQSQREKVKHSILSSEGAEGAKQQRKEMIEISMEQVNKFCGNILQVKSTKDEILITMSETAYASYLPGQIEAMKKYCESIVTVSIPTIEQYGGGGSRCMMAEIFLEQQ